jgi:hypothetical protein
MTTKRILLVAAAALAAMPAARSATPEAWNEFQQAVAAACLAKAEPLFETAEATVDPFGSESFGLALIQGKARGADAEIAAICVYDKVTREAEIGGELPMGEVASAGSVPNPIAVCETNCQGILAALAPADAVSLEELADRVALTIEANAGTPGLPSDPGAEAALARLTGGALSGTLGEVGTGERSCTLYWYGFLDEASRRVGTHRCRIERDGDRLTVAKLTGERLAGLVQPLGESAGILVGRTYLDGHQQRSYDPARPTNAENENFGNHVGFAFADGGALVVISADMLGFTEPDETFFELLVIE